MERDILKPKGQNQSRRPVEFHEAIGGTAPMAMAEADAVSMRAIIVAALVGLGVLALVAGVSMFRTLPTAVDSGIAPGTVIPLNETIDSSRATNAVPIAYPENTGTQPANTPIIRDNTGYNLQGSVGTAAVR